MHTYILYIHTNKQTNIHTYIHARIDTHCMCESLYIVSYDWSCAHTEYIHISGICENMCMHLYIYIYTYIHTRAHTQVNTNIQLQCDVLMLPTSSRTCSALSRWKVVNWTREWKRTQLASHVKRFTGSHRVCMLSGIQRYFAQLHSNDSTNHTTGWFCSTTALVLSIHPQPFAYT